MEIIFLSQTTFKLNFTSGNKTCEGGRVKVRDGITYLRQCALMLHLVELRAKDIFCSCNMGFELHGQHRRLLNTRDRKDAVQLQQNCVLQRFQLGLESRIQLSPCLKAIFLRSGPKNFVRFSSVGSFKSA